MLPFSPYPILLITLNAMLVASSERIFFFYVSPFTGLFLDKFSLQDFFCGGGGGGGELSPHFRLFLIVRPLVLTKSCSRGRPRLRI